MESSGRNGDDAERPAGDGGEPIRLPLERSPEGRFVVRSSSHPPDEQTSSIDSSGVHSRPQSGPAPMAAEAAPSARDAERGRPGRSTPAERPRKRKELKQGSTYMADVRARCDTPRALPGTRISDRPPRDPSPGREHPLPAIAALATAPVSAPAGAETRSVDEITRRVRRPASTEAAPPPTGLDPPVPWRALATAGLIAALFMLALWLLG